MKFQKILCTPLDTPERYHWSKFGVSRTFLAPKSPSGVTLKYYLICARTHFLAFFGRNQVKIFALAINSSTNGGFCVYFSNNYYNSLKTIHKTKLDFDHKKCRTSPLTLKCFYIRIQEDFLQHSIPCCYTYVPFSQDMFSLKFWAFLEIPHSLLV